jgi:hypothetical protein
MSPLKQFTLIALFAQHRPAGLSANTKVPQNPGQARDWRPSEIELVK